MAEFKFRAHKVSSVIKTLDQRVEVMRRQINREAARRLRSSEREAARVLISLEDAVASFSREVEGLSRSWDQLTVRVAEELHGLGIEVKAASTKKGISTGIIAGLALGIVSERGGRAHMTEVLSDMERWPGLNLTASDLAERNGRPKWHHAVQRVHRQLQRGGELEKREDDVWQLTAKGRTRATAG